MELLNSTQQIRKVLITAAHFFFKYTEARVYLNDEASHIFSFRAI